MNVVVSMRYRGDKEDQRADFGPPVLSTRDCSFAGQRARGALSLVLFLKISRRRPVATDVIKKYPVGKPRVSVSM